MVAAWTSVVHAADLAPAPRASGTSTPSRGVGASPDVEFGAGAPPASVVSCAERTTPQGGSATLGTADRACESRTTRAVAVALSIVPGVLVHGTGNYVLGREETGTRLLVAEGVGLALIGLGGFVIVSTGAARQWVGPAAALTIAGTGIFGISFQSDVYSSLAPDGGFGAATGREARFESELGYLYVYDPQFSYRHLSVSGIDARFGRWRTSPRLWVAPWGSTERLSLPVAFRALGATPDRSSSDGSYLDLEASWTRHTYPESRFTMSSAGLMVLGRLDLMSYDPHLAGSFAELGVGAATQLIDWEIAGLEPESATLLLGRFGFGIYVGRGGAGSGEWQLYYDHRHDDFAAGLLMEGVGSGVAGHLGLEGEHFVTDEFGLGMVVEYGSALVTGLSAHFRYGGDG